MKRLDSEKIKIIGQWSIIHIFFFALFSVFLPGFAASSIALILTVSAFFHESNYLQIQKMKRPQFILRPENVH